MSEPSNQWPGGALLKGRNRRLLLILVAVAVVLYFGIMARWGFRG